jgi:hypothetical protein
VVGIGCVENSSEAISISSAAVVYAKRYGSIGIGRSSGLEPFGGFTWRRELIGKAWIRLDPFGAEFFM